MQKINLVALNIQNHNYYDVEINYKNTTAADKKKHPV